jgi:protein phosphatase
MTTRPETQDEKIRVVGAMRTDVGRVRSSNEDAVVFVAPAEGSPEARRGYFALVADGMGGHAAGEVASALAAEVVRRVFFSLDRPPAQSLEAAFEAANRAILDEAARRPECKGMGTTCTAIAIRDARLWLAHIGDSRAYILRDGEITQLSDDQTLHAQLVRDGVLTQEEADKSPGGNVILQALGTRPDIAPTIWTEGLPLRIGDLLLLCSDGLSNLVADDELVSIVSGRPPQQACPELIEAALRAGGYDNVSVGVFLIEAREQGLRADQAATQRIVIADPDAGSPPTRVMAVS